MNIRSLLSSTLALIVALLIGTLAGAIFVKAHYDLPEGPTAMKQFLEEYGLNLLGDTIAGFLGLATFIVVVFTYSAQKAMARQTVEEMKQQNRLSAKIANANYQLALHEPRLKAYRHFHDARFRFLAAKDSNPLVVEAMRKAVKEAEFLYDSDLQFMLKRLSDGLTQMQTEKAKNDVNLRQRQNGGLSEEENARLDGDLEFYENLCRAAFAQLQSAELQERFSKHLRLVQTIVDETAIKQ